MHNFKTMQAIQSQRTESTTQGSPAAKLVLLARAGAPFALLVALGASASAQVPLYDKLGDGTNDRFGVSAESAGDVNNDGVNDWIVGAPQDGNVFSGGLGYARVFSGTDGTSLFTVAGVQATTAFGNSVAGVGDVNGDNHDDVAVGTPFFDGAGLSRGRMSIFSGVDGSVIRHHEGLVNGDRLGHKVAGVGDVDNDGTDDYAACAFNSDVIALNSGTVLVYSGASGSLLHSFEGSINNAHFGVGLDGMGDYNNDGFDDILAGGERGPVNVYSGQDGSILNQYPEPVVDSLWGASVKSVGDLTGDNVHEVIIGAPQSSQLFGVGNGYARVLNGATGALIREMIGDANGDSFGFSVDTAGDYNGDGTVDYLIGAPVAGDSNRPGYARVINGVNGAILQSINAGSNTSNLGAAVCFLGDLTGDGGGEIGVTQPEDAVLTVNVGSMQVYSGSAPTCDVPSTYCVAIPNSTGNVASIGFSGSNSFAANDLVITATDCPPGQMGIFFYGNTQVFVPFGSGIRCVGGNLFRLPPIQTIDGSGNVSTPLNLNGLPNPNGQISQGETWNFQLWFRDPGDGNANTNLTNGLEVTFCE